MNAVYWDKDKSMAEKRAEQSNPFSSGGGGISYEICVQAYFAIYIITGDELPFFRNTKATKMKLQGHYAGYNTDDCIVFGEDGRKILCQIKNSVSITEHDNTFKAVITDAWNDYCNTELFNTEVDRIVLIVSGLSATDIANTTTLFDWARHCENSAEFVQKVTTEKFSSKEKRKKYQAIKTQLSVAKGENLSDDETWDFFRHYYIQVLELNRAESPLWVAVSNQLSNKVGKDGVANDLYHIIADYNQNAGTATREMLLRDLSLEGLLFENALIKNIKSHNRIIAASMRNSINGKAIDRGDYVARVEESLLKNDILLVTGERGVGKTGIVKNYIDLHDNSTFYVFFRAEEFNKPSISGVFSELNWKFDLEQLQQVSLGYQRKCIVDESLERILENEHQKAFADLMTFVYQNTGWKIIASIRDYALQQVLMNFLAICPLRTEYIN